MLKTISSSKISYKPNSTKKALKELLLVEKVHNIIFSSTTTMNPKDKKIIKILGKAKNKKSIGDKLKMLKENLDPCTLKADWKKLFKKEAIKKRQRYKKQRFHFKKGKKVTNSSPKLAK